MALSRWLSVRSRWIRRLTKLLVIVLSCYSVSYFAFVSFNNGNKVKKQHNVTQLTSDSGGNFTEEEQDTADASRGKSREGKLTLYTWRDMCGAEVKVLQNSPFYPSYPDEKKLISEFQIVDNDPEYGQTIAGFIYPPESGSYRFAIASDDSSELWLSQSEDPEDKRLIARVFAEESVGWTQKNELDKYPEQISKAASLRNGSRYYIEVIHKQGNGNGFVQVFWSRPDDADFKLISPEYLSPYSAIKDAANHLLTIRLRKSESTWKKYSNFLSLPLISEGNYLPPCTYKSSFIIDGQIDKDNGIQLVRLSNVFPQDDTFMGNKERVWSWRNRVADRAIVESVVDKLIASLCTKTAMKYFLKRIDKVLQKPDPIYGDRYSVDLEVGLHNTNQSFRLSKHVYQKKGSDKLCFPEGFNWNSKATVYFILPVKNQGRWVYHFINELTVASLLTGDTNFHVIVIDFESQDIDMAEAFNTPLLGSKHTIVNLKGKFYKTLALNEGVRKVPGIHNILFLFDLHLDVPVSIIDAARKNTIEGRMVYSPIVGRLDCASSTEEHKGYWEMEGYGLLSVYKSDWIRLGGMNSKDFKYKWDGEDWDLLDRVLAAQLEVERVKHPGLYHHYHPKRKMWN